MSSRGTTADRNAQLKASALFDKSARRQIETSRRAEEERLVDRQVAAKTERLRALRLERDAMLERQAAEQAAKAPPLAPRKKKKVSPA